jgi:hypothetical protein
MIRMTLFAIVLCCSWGCNSAPEMGTVTGKVTLYGKPITRGIIGLHPVKGAPQSAAIVDGAFDTGEIPVGDYTVTIELSTVPGAPATPATAANQNNIGAGLGASDNSPSQAARAKAPQLDSKFGDTATSGLAVKVVPGPNTYNPPDLK